MLGWVVMVYALARVARDYSVTESVYNKEILVEPSKHTIYIKPNNKNNFSEYQEHWFDINRLGVFLTDDRFYLQGDPKIELVSGETFAIDIEKSAKGNSSADAKKNSNDIEYFWLQCDTIIYVDPVFTLNEGSKIRNQKLEVVLSIPKGLNVVVDDELSWVVNSNLD